MYRIIAFLLIVFFSFSISALEDVAGVISLSTKNLIIINVDGLKRAAKTGDYFFPQETIITPDGGKTQLLFRDQMTINLSQGSELKVDDFIYDDKNATNNIITASIKKGAFKFISGRIATEDKDAMKIKTPKTQIAIRGTSVVGDINPTGEEKIILLDGAIQIASNDAGQFGALQTVSQSGFGVTVDLAGNISLPTAFPEEFLTNVFEKVELSEGTAPLPSREEQQLVAAVSKSLLDDKDNEMKAMFGDKAKEVSSALLDAANKVAEKTGDTSSLNVGKIIALASKNSELSTLIFEQDGKLVSALYDNVTVDGRVFAYMAAGYSRPTALSTSGVQSATSKQGTITLNFNNMNLTTSSSQGLGTGSGTAAAVVEVDLDDQKFSANLKADFTLGAFSYSIDKNTVDDSSNGFVTIDSTYSLNFKGSATCGGQCGIYGSGADAGTVFNDGDAIGYVDVIRTNVTDTTGNVTNTFVTLEIDMGATVNNELYSTALLEINDNANVTDNINNSDPVTLGNYISASQDILAD
jgi:hypothetical protein